MSIEAMRDLADASGIVRACGHNELAQRLLVLAEQAQKQEPYCWTWDEFVSGGKWRAEYGWKKPERKVTNLQPLYTSPPQRQPLTDWTSVDERLPDAGGYYLVTVATDEGPHVDVLLFNEKRKHWEHEGEPTFCHSYYFEPTHWAHRPEAAHGIK